MKTPTIITKNLHLLERVVQSNSPAILTAVGVAGIIGTVVATHKATTKANVKLNSEVYARNVHRQAPEQPYTIADLNFKDKFELTWKAYAPVVIVASLSVAAVVGAQYVNTKRMAALAAGYAVLESKHEEYKDKVLELVGKKKADQVDEALYKDMVTKAKVGGVEIVAGDVPCVDALTNLPFSSNMESLRKAANDINERIIHGDLPSVSDLYSLLGIPHNKLSDAFGWNDENMCELKPTTVLNEDMVPVLVMDFSVLPIANYWKQGI